MGICGGRLRLARSAATLWLSVTTVLFLDRTCSDAAQTSAITKMTLPTISNSQYIYRNTIQHIGGIMFQTSQTGRSWHSRPTTQRCTHSFRPCIRHLICPARKELPLEKVVSAGLSVCFPRMLHLCLGCRSMLIVGHATSVTWPQELDPM